MNLVRFLSVFLAGWLLMACGALETATQAAKTPVANVGNIHIVDPWVRTATTGTTGVVYMTMTNSGAEADMLVAASSDVAPNSELHQVTQSNGVMEMRPIEGGIELPPASTVVLKSGGSHIMMIGLTRDLRAGETINLKLRFAKAGEVSFTAPVRER